ncbi:protein of unknown function DUF552 [Beutenbergia cavernae DSM 12333]|uniref:Cell division protein SepF n=1 Tax=Beutenbergia cavernae (strain ATCC BAA-8 / DSM 12333 / CCUG 43141 / JCM 11478 / NBRC 16432 / NCIMB 13614 / HKI 0122) TaxID=471853 RepID=C5BW54_BEUC1|nr:cell division protein SepF [Beutenbergia cavernae]ACQ80655.1 protein of unknown function DUF552 [Beutenbergia cavernae DSM 12333]
MGALRKTMLYLGLSEADRAEGAESEYAEYDEYAQSDAPEQQKPREHAPAAVTPIRSARSAASSAGSAGDLRRITTVHPRTYNDAKIIGESFRSGTPVIMNLTDMTDAEAKRLVDFSAGLVFGLHGSIERVTNKVFLLSPASVEIATDSAEDEEPQARFFNQS